MTPVQPRRPGRKATLLYAWLAAKLSHTDLLAVLPLVEAALTEAKTGGRTAADTECPMIGNHRFASDELRELREAARQPRQSSDADRV